MSEDTIELFVSDEHIKMGQECDKFMLRSQSCALALAARDKFGEDFDAVGFSELYCKSCKYRMDQYTQQTISAMDYNRTYIPDAFTAILTRVK